MQRSTETKETSRCRERRPAVLGAFALGAILAIGPGCTQLLPVLVVDAGGSAVDAPELDATRSDAPALDAPPSSDDAPPALDAATDARRDMPRDAPATDAPTEVDAGRDGGPDAGPPASCDDAYGSLPGYVLCDETATTCTFGVTFSSGALSDCRSVCMTAGGDCREAFRLDAMGGSCALTDRQACGAGSSPAICICSR